MTQVIFCHLKFGYKKIKIPQWILAWVEVFWEIVNCYGTISLYGHSFSFKKGSSDSHISFTKTVLLRIIHCQDQLSPKVTLQWHHPCQLQRSSKWNEKYTFLPTCKGFKVFCDCVCMYMSYSVGVASSFPLCSSCLLIVTTLTGWSKKKRGGVEELVCPQPNQGRLRGFWWLRGSEYVVWWELQRKHWQFSYLNDQHT